MKWIFLSASLFISLLLPYQGDAGETCFTGVRMQNSPMTSPDIECEEGQACAVHSINATISIMEATQSANMKVGQCIPESVCPLLSCATVLSNLQSMLQGVNAEVTGCQLSCNSVPVPPSSGSSLPLVPVPYNPATIPRPGQHCNVPLWNAREKDNWSGFLGRRKRRPKPAFVLIVKKVQRGYKANKKYTVKLVSRTKLKFNGFFVILESNSTQCQCSGSSDCSLGRFIGAKTRRTGEALVHAGCEQPVFMDFPPGGFKSSKMTWQAPNCADSVVKMRATVRGKDGRLYTDNDELPLEHQFLTKVISAKRRKRNQRRRN